MPDTSRRRPPIVTICGSTRFRDEIADANRELTLAGHVVLAPGVFGHGGDEMTAAQKIALDELHLRKIDLAEMVFVVNPGGYIGDSTRCEIEYARRTGKQVRYLVAAKSEPPTAAEPAPKMADPIDPRPGDIWHDAVPAFTDGQFWHARDDGNGGVELYEKDGTAVIRAHQVASMRGGMTLVHREQP